MENRRLIKYDELMVDKEERSSLLLVLLLLLLLLSSLFTATPSIHHN